jgi:hypothetical protein
LALSELFQLSSEGFRYEIVRDCNVLTATRTTFTLFLGLLLKSDTTDQTQIDNQCRPQENTKFKWYLTLLTIFFGNQGDTSTKLSYARKKCGPI